MTATEFGFWSIFPNMLSIRKHVCWSFLALPCYGPSSEVFFWGIYEDCVRQSFEASSFLRTSGYWNRCSCNFFFVCWMEWHNSFDAMLTEICPQCFLRLLFSSSIWFNIWDAWFLDLGLWWMESYCSLLRIFSNLLGGLKIFKVPFGSLLWDLYVAKMIPVSQLLQCLRHYWCTGLFSHCLCLSGLCNFETVS